MAFSIPRANVIESDEGFSVEILGRTGLTYREGDRSMFVDSEALWGPNGMMVDARSIKRWKAPHEGDGLDEAKREQIVARICEAFSFRGIPTHVHR